MTNPACVLALVMVHSKYVWSLRKCWSFGKPKLIAWGDQLQKEVVFFTQNTFRVDRIQCSLGCTVGQFPFTYLGAPIVKGRGKAADFDHLIQKIIQKLEGWKTFCLFLGKSHFSNQCLQVCPFILSLPLLCQKWSWPELKNLWKLFFGIRREEVGTIGLTGARFVPLLQKVVWVSGIWRILSQVYKENLLGIFFKFSLE